MSQTNLADAFLQEQARLRNLLVEYAKIPTGAFGAAAIRSLLTRAARAAIERDVVAMTAIYKEMQEVK